jgi:signal transduction histidine kinase
MFRIRTQPSLHRDFALLSLFIVFIFILVSAWVAYETFEDHAEKTVKQMESEALRVDRALIVEIENASYILESMGRQILANDYADLNAISQLFNSFDKRGYAKNNIFSWSDAKQGLRVASNLGVMKKPIDISDRDYVKKAISEPWKVHVGRPIEGRVSQKWVLPISMGLARDNGEFLGVVAISLDVKELTEAVSSVIKGSDMQFAITNSSLSLLTEYSPEKDFFNRTFDLDTLTKVDFKEAKSKLVSRPSLFDSNEIFRYYEASSQFPFIIFLAHDPRVSGSIYEIVLPRLAQLMVIALFLLFVLYTVRKRIIQPVIQLTNRTSNIVRGEQFQPELQSGPLEIYQLAQEIKRMCDYIEERRRIESELRLKNAELTKIKEAATLTNQVKAEFFSHVGQELSEPVQMILEEIETIKDQHFGPLNNPRYTQHAHDIYDQAQQVLAMLQDIKAISEAETGLLALNEAELDVQFALQKCIRIFKERSTYGVDATLDLNGAVPKLKADELRLKQLILNVLNFAAPQLGSGDVIRISTQMKSGEMLILLSYSATSAERTQARLAGSVIPMVSSPQRSQLGLGMALAKLLIALHQGALEIKTLPDRTTTITVRFPGSRVL